MSVDRRIAAKAWAARGFKVFRVRAGRKEPLQKGWIDEATSDAAEVERLWSDPVTGWALDHNIGVLTDGMIVVDIDDKKGKTGTASYVDLDLTWDTLIVRTPSGGRHAYFDGPSRSLSSRGLGPGLDIRSFHGYVLAPGSAVTGAGPGLDGEYTLENDVAPARVPAHLLERLDAPVERQSSAPMAEMDLPGALLRATDWLQHEAPLAIEGCGGDMQTFKVAATLKDFGVSEDAAFGLLTEFWNDRCSPPWDWDELRSKVENAFGYGKVSPGAHTPEAAFADVAPMRVETAPKVWLRHGAAFAPIDWLVYEMLPRVGVGLLVAPPHAGKTFAALDLARAVATGKPFFGVEPDERGAVAILAGEGAGGMSMRMAALQEPEALPIYVRDAGLLRGRLDELLADLKALSAASLADHGVPLRLVIVDTVASNGLVEDENDNTEVTIAMKALGKLGEVLGCCVMGTHHTPKAGGDARGAGAWRGSADFIWEVHHESPTEKVRELVITKQREGALKKLGAFTLTPVILGTDSRGREVTSACVAAAPPVSPKERETRFGQLLVESVEWAVADGYDMVDGKKCVEVEAVKEIFGERKDGSRDKVQIGRAFRAALDFALAAGAVEQVPWNGRAYVTLRRI